jgi:hypothetical protein
LRATFYRNFMFCHSVFHKTCSNSQCQVNGISKFDIAVITKSRRLPCDAVIHTVGPMMGQGNEDNNCNIDEHFYSGHHCEVQNLENLKSSLTILKVY